MRQIVDGDRAARSDGHLSNVIFAKADTPAAPTIDDGVRAVTEQRVVCTSQGRCKTDAREARTASGIAHQDIPNVEIPTVDGNVKLGTGVTRTDSYICVCGRAVDSIYAAQHHRIAQGNLGKRAYSCGVRQVIEDHIGAATYHGIVATDPVGTTG